MSTKPNRPSPPFPLLLVILSNFLKPPPACGASRIDRRGGRTQRRQLPISRLCLPRSAYSPLSVCQTPPPPQIQVTTTVTPLPDTIERRVAELARADRQQAPHRHDHFRGRQREPRVRSGHISRAADGKLITGRVGEELTVAQGKDAARQCGLAILASLRQELGTLDRVRRVVKVLGMVNCPPGFKDQPQVVNGFSELMLDVFGRERGLGARSAVGAASLPSNVAVEVEAVFEIVP